MCTWNQTQFFEVSLRFLNLEKCARTRIVGFKLGKLSLNLHVSDLQLFFKQSK